MYFVLCVSLSSGDAGGGVLTFVLTLTFTARVTEQDKGQYSSSLSENHAKPAPSEREPFKTKELTLH